MPDLDSTNWQLIQKAAAGSSAARDEFARRYLPPVMAYLKARWSGNQLKDAVDDASQEVFVDLFRDGGVLARADPGRGGFRALLYGTARIVALRCEEAAARRREAPAPSSLVHGALPVEEDLARAFDRAWAVRVVSEARDLMAARARARGERQRRWVEMLQLRFEDSVPIREIARRWNVDPAWLHHEFASARDAFKSALQAVVARYQGGTPEQIEAEGLRILDLLG